ncbi:ATP-binding domain-containing protein [Leptospira sp. 96542]|nr:ATP-binding domain-containing protein [Leptospira sp. 96542]
MQEQEDVLALDLNKSVLISGPPGSGKTNLLLLRANHHYIAHPDTEFYIVCFTGLLRGFIRTGASQYKFPRDRIITQIALFERILSDNGESVARKVGEKFDEYQEKLTVAMERLVEKGIGKGVFPVLFVDEAQDYSARQLAVLQHFSNQISCAADARQGIYKHAADGVEWLKRQVWDESITLKFHHRNGPAILEVADKMMNGKFDHVSMLPTQQYQGDRSTVDVECKPLNDQLIELRRRLVLQLGAFPGQLIGVLTPRGEELQHIVSALSTDSELAGKFTNAHERDFDPEKPIWVCKAHSSKGLEFRCVHLVAADMVAQFHEYERRLAFTAVTRAKTSLVIYHEDELHAFFAAALAKPPKEKIKTAMLFGKKP